MGMAKPQPNARENEFVVVVIVVVVHQEGILDSLEGRRVIVLLFGTRNMSSLSLPLVRSAAAAALHHHRPSMIHRTSSVVLLRHFHRSCASSISFTFPSQPSVPHSVPPRHSDRHGSSLRNQSTDASFQMDMADGSMDDLCRKHMDVSAQEFAIGCSFLHQIALGTPPSTLKAVLEDRPTLVNFRDYDRRTPLHIAASEGHLDLCRYLLEQGARINRSDRWGGSPLDDAHRHRHADVVELLRSYGGTFGSPSQANNFIAAASEGDLEEVQALLEYGNIDLNAGDYDQRTALHLAAGENQVAIVKLLCEKGANVNVQDRWGNRPLDDAVNANHQACIEILEQYGGKHGTTARAGAATMGQEALLDLMHTYGKVRDGKLSMDWHDVKALLEGVGNEASDEVVQKLFQVADVHGTGVIDTQDFIQHSDTFLGGRPARIILVVGGPGSGKGVLSERLVKECGVVHLSSGELLRDEVAQGTELGKHVEDIMKSGGLVSSAIMVTLMQKRMKDHPGKRVLLDGFPRSRENAQDLVTLCGKPELALHLTCDDTILLERIMKRGESGERADDNFQTAIQRVRNYHKYHHVTLDFLREQNVPIVFLDCSQTPEGVWDQLRSIGRLMRSAVRVPISGAATTATAEVGESAVL